jgi:hypothetical protein
MLKIAQVSLNACKSDDLFAGEDRPQIVFGCCGGLLGLGKSRLISCDLIIAIGKGFHLLGQGVVALAKGCKFRLLGLGVIAALRMNAAIAGVIDAVCLDSDFSLMRL